MADADNKSKHCAAEQQGAAAQFRSKEVAEVGVIRSTFGMKGCCRIGPFSLVALNRGSKQPPIPQMLADLTSALRFLS
jgi:hypothetical protein